MPDKGKGFAWHMACGFLPRGCRVLVEVLHLPECRRCVGGRGAEQARAEAGARQPAEAGAGWGAEAGAGIGGDAAAAAGSGVNASEGVGEGGCGGGRLRVRRRARVRGGHRV